MLLVASCAAPPKAAVNERPLSADSDLITPLRDSASPEWSDGIILHNKLRVNTMDEYKAIRVQHNIRIRDRVERIAKRLHVGTIHVLAFEECAEWCDNAHGMADKTNQQMQASFQEPHGPWSSCFAGCNYAVRRDKDGSNNEACKQECNGNTVEPYYVRRRKNCSATGPAHPSQKCSHESNRCGCGPVVPGSLHKVRQLCGGAPAQQEGAHEQAGL
jgi:hypothetical protein